MEIDPLFWERNMGLSTILNLFLFSGEISTYTKDFSWKKWLKFTIFQRKKFQFIKFL